MPWPPRAHVCRPKSRAETCYALLAESYILLQSCREVFNSNQDLTRNTRTRTLLETCKSFYSITLFSRKYKMHEVARQDITLTFIIDSSCLIHSAPIHQSHDCVCFCLMDMGPIRRNRWSQKNKWCLCFKYWSDLLWWGRLCRGTGGGWDCRGSGGFLNGSYIMFPMKYIQLLVWHLFLVFLANAALNLSSESIQAGMKNQF